MSTHSDQSLHELLQAMPDAIVMVNGEGIIVHANGQAETMFGWPPGGLIGQPVDSLLPERYRGGHAKHRRGFFSQPRARGMGAGGELFGRRRDGDEFPVEISLSPVGTSAGPMVLSAIRDATARKQVEASLLQASRLKSQFLANMSHELRTPLNGIIGFSELLVDGKAGALSERQRGFLQDILNSGRHLLDLVNDLLDISKIEAGRMELHEERFRLPEVIDEACATLAPAMADRRQVLRRELDAAVEWVYLDRQKFKQILLNLASNAVKFTPDEGEIAIRAALAVDGRLRFEVCDTGIGISEADRERLFIEFERLLPARGQHQGTGLGLALTRRLVELQGGQIEVRSTPGRGSVFSVYLPLRGGRT